MKAKIVGVSRKKGDYEGQAYDNVYLHAVCLSRQMMAGFSVVSAKVRVADFPVVFEDCHTQKPIERVDDVLQLVGADVVMDVDRFNVCESVVLSKHGKIDLT